MQEGENIFQLYHNRQQPLSIANWCDSFAEKEPQEPQEAVKHTRTPKAKISIKRFQNKTVRHMTSKSSNSLPLSANLTEVLRPAPFKVQTRQVMPKMQFIYRSNTHHFMLSESLQLQRHSASSKTIKIVEHFTEPHVISMEIREQTAVSNQEMVIANDDLKSTKKKIDHHQFNQQEEAVSILAQGDRDQLLLHVEKKESKEDNQKALIKSQQIFTKPKTLIGSGNLFGAVRRSQTILNDYKSQSSQQSQVLQDFKSLMSKIQEHRLEEEEFQEK